MSTIESENIEKLTEDRKQGALSAVEGTSNPPEKKNSKFSTFDDDLSFLNSLPVIGKPEKKPAVTAEPRHSGPEQAPLPPVEPPQPAPKADQKETVRPAPPSVDPAPVIAKTPAPVVKEIEQVKEVSGQNAPPAVEKTSTPPEKKNSKSNTFDDDLSFLNSLPAIGKPEKKPAVIEKPQAVTNSSSKIAPQPAAPVPAPQPPVATPPPAPKADQKETVRPAPPAVKLAPVIEKTPAPVVKEIEKPKEVSGQSAPPAAGKTSTPPEKKNAKSNTFDDDLSFLNSLPSIGKPEKKPAVTEEPVVSSNASGIKPQHAVPEQASQPPAPKADQKETVRPAPPSVKPAPVIAKTQTPVVKLKPQPQPTKHPPKAAPSSQKQVPKKTQSQIQREAKNRLEKEKAEAKKSKKQEAHQAAKNGKPAPNAKEQPPEKKSLFRRLLKF